MYAAPALLGIVLTTFGVCSSIPPTAPSSSAAEISESFIGGLKKVCMFIFNSRVGISRDVLSGVSRSYRAFV